ncbi:unnamed protein product [Caenorhabditis auriculariae]|uniref:Uncharacterized protein n=1 Tax=Caenorhabditis auriculariae TaxID=2777116 RepID=A0A8S1HAC8_9PELO|nr:unnamed protein product [Caenorhabditis auriculariae]
MKLLVLLCLLAPVHTMLWLPFANFGSMFETIKEAAFKHSIEAAKEDHNHSPLSIFEFGKELLNGLGKFISSSFEETEKLNIANGLREIFNVTTTRIIRFTTGFPHPPTFPPYIPEPTTPQPQAIAHHKTWPRITTTPTVPPTTTPSTTTATEAPTTTLPMTTPKTSTFTLPTPYPIWPTTSRRPPITWKQITSSNITSTTSAPEVVTARKWIPWKVVTPTPPLPTTTTTTTTTVRSSLTSEASLPDYFTTDDYEMATSELITEASTTVTAAIPHIVKARKYTRPPVSDRVSITTPATISQKCEICKPGSRCNVSLRSFETSDPIFQYCYSHSTMIDESMQDLLRDTQTSSFPSHVTWHQSVPPEVLQLVQTIMALYRPSRCLVIGVFTGLGLLGVAEHVDSRGIVVALEHPGYAVFWERVGQKHAKKLTTAQMSRIQIRTSESIEKSLPRLAANEPNTFDFVFLDDFKRDNYLDDYEHAIRLLRNGGLLVINQALNGGGVLSGVDNMTNEDRVIRNMNIRIKQDARVRASLLPYGGGTWIISKKVKR